MERVITESNDILEFRKYCKKDLFVEDIAVIYGDKTFNIKIGDRFKSVEMGIISKFELPKIVRPRYQKNIKKILIIKRRNDITRLKDQLMAKLLSGESRLTHITLEMTDINTFEVSVDASKEEIERVIYDITSCFNDKRWFYVKCDISCATDPFKSLHNHMDKYYKNSVVKDNLIIRVSYKNYKAKFELEKGVSSDRAKAIIDDISHDIGIY